MAPVGFPSEGLISHALVCPLQTVPADGDTDSLPLPGVCYILCHHQRRSHAGGGCSGTHRILAPPASPFKQPHESSQAPSASISASFHRQLWHFRLGGGAIRQPKNRRSTRPQESLGMPLRPPRPGGPTACPHPWWETRVPASGAEVNGLGLDPDLLSAPTHTRGVSRGKLCTIAVRRVSRSQVP